ncbi:MAG TPA: histidine phosphatase family protein [Ktedonobacterales bacterium]|nr:histidine phosphatase family protein [Ktedonobacterales bacterium]
MSAPLTTTPVMRLILARHGEAEGSREFRFNGSSDVPLTSHGMEQARLLADALYPLAPVAIYSSPLARARATAEAIATRVNLTVEIQPGLREQSYGSWERLTADEARQRDPKRFAAWSTGQRIAPPAGETLSAVRQRVVACVCELAERHGGETVVLVAHVGPIKALLCTALGLPLSGARRFWIDPASYSVVDWRVTADGQQRSLVRGVNIVSHLAVLAR